MKKLFPPLTEKRVYALILVNVLLLFLLLNIFFSLAAERFPLKLDTTEAKLYRLSETTVSIAEALEARTDIYVIEAEEDFPTVLRGMLERYGRLSGNINVSYIDPYENPVFLDNYRQQGISPGQADILVAGPNGVRQIPYSELLVYSGEEFTGIQLEQQVTSAIVYVNTGEHASVLFTAGHNERTTQSLEAVFGSNNYAVTTAALTETSSAEADLIVIACPTKDFTADETAVLKSFLQNGGSVMAFFEPGVNDYPNLGGLLGDWGLALRDDVVFDGRYNVGGSPVNIMPMFTTHPINSYFEENRYPMVMPSCRSIETASVSGGTDVTPLLVTSSDSYAKQGSSYQTTARADGDRKGSMTVSAISERESGGAIVLTASRYVYADDVMGAESYGNSAFITEAANYLTGGGSAVSIPAKQTASPLLAVSGSHQLLAGAVFVVLIPLAVLAAGLRVFLKRRVL